MWYDESSPSSSPNKWITWGKHRASSYFSSASLIWSRQDLAYQGWRYLYLHVIATSKLNLITTLRFLISAHSLVNFVDFLRPLDLFRIPGLLTFWKMKCFQNFSTYFLSLLVLFTPTIQGKIACFIFVLCFLRTFLRSFRRFIIILNRFSIFYPLSIRTWESLGPVHLALEST